MPQTTLDRDALRTYDGRVLHNTKELKTSACCCTDERLTPRGASTTGSCPRGVSHWTLRR